MLGSEEQCHIYNVHVSEPMCQSHVAIDNYIIICFPSRVIFYENTKLDTVLCDQCYPKVDCT
jgi:hypothetical protein